MEPVITTIISALIAGATAKAGDVASQAVEEAYKGLKSLLIEKLGKGGAVQSVEDEPDSEPARVTLAEALSKRGLSNDRDLAALAQSVEQEILQAHTAGSHTGEIVIGSIRGHVNATVERLVASERIKIDSVVAETSDATVRDLTAGPISKN